MTDDLERLIARISCCTICSRDARPAPIRLLRDGSRGKVLLVAGQHDSARSADEATKAAQRIGRILRRLDALDDCAIWTTYEVRCKEGRRAGDWQGAVEACGEWLRAEIDTLRPNAVIYTSPDTFARLHGIVPDAGKVYRDRETTGEARLVTLVGVFAESVSAALVRPAVDALVDALHNDAPVLDVDRCRRRKLPAMLPLFRRKP